MKQDRPDFRIQGEKSQVAVINQQLALSMRVGWDSRWEDVNRERTLPLTGLQNTQVGHTSETGTLSIPQTLFIEAFTEN